MTMEPSYTTLCLAHRSPWLQNDQIPQAKIQGIVIGISGQQWHTELWETILLTFLKSVHCRSSFYLGSSSQGPTSMLEEIGGTANFDKSGIQNDKIWDALANMNLRGAHLTTAGTPLLFPQQLICHSSNINIKQSDDKLISLWSPHFLLTFEPTC